MANKFGRNYKLVIQTIDGATLDIEPPFTVEFDINRKNFSQCNTASFRIYNLSKDNRGQIQKNQFDIGLRLEIAFLAGYGSDLALLFSGTITSAYSVREGSNYITSVEATDGGYAFGNAQLSKQYASGTPYRSVVLDMIKTLKNYGVSPGSIGNILGKTERGASFSGSTAEILKQLTNGAFFVDNGKAHVLSDSEILPGQIMVIDSSSGLLNTPRREASFLVFDMLFEPKVQVGNKIRLESSTASQFSGDYRVDSVHHRGVISEAVSGQATTSLGCIFGGAFTTVRQEF